MQYSVMADLRVLEYLVYPCSLFYDTPVTKDRVTIEIIIFAFCLWLYSTIRLP